MTPRPERTWRRRSPAWLPCPSCGAHETVLIKLRHGPRRYSEAGVTVRGHECLDCRHRFISAQRVVPDDELGELAVEVAA